MADIIDYEIFGDDMQLVEIALDPGEGVRAEAGAMMYMEDRLIEKRLKPGERLGVDTGCIVGFSRAVDYDIQLVGGFKNALFGGEGIFVATLTGPGVVYLQSLPFSRLADRIVQASRVGIQRHVGEKPGVAGLGANILGGLLGGDR